MKRILFALAALLPLAAGCNPEVDPTSVTLGKHDLMLKVGGTEVLEDDNQLFALDSAGLAYAMFCVAE